MKKFILILFLTIMTVGGLIDKENISFANSEEIGNSYKIKLLDDFINGDDNGMARVTYGYHNSPINSIPVTNDDIDKARSMTKAPVKPLSGPCESASILYKDKAGDSASTKAVIDNCMVSINELQERKWKVEKLVIPYLVYLRSDSGVCTGFLVNKEIIVTAMHCNATVAYFSDGEVRTINPEDRTPCTSTKINYCDYVTIKVKETNIPKLNFNWVNASEHDKLLVAGVTITDVNSAPRKYEPNIMYATNEDANKNCLATIANDDCVVDLCTVIEGFSGAPIVNVDKSEAMNKLVVSGIHISSDRTLIKSLCKLNEPSLLSNYGMPASKLPF